MIQIEKILVATDFSDHSAVALQYAQEFSKAFGAHILLCNVVESSGFLSHLPPGGEGYFPPNMDEIRQKNAEEKCQTVIDDAGLENASVHVVVGKPFVEIVRLAKSENVDLLILGTHGRGAVAHMLLGSVAEKVVRNAPCPVLTVREGEHEFVHP
ncbi:MAG: universal stress protein [Planctomycetaceae bacterium]